MSTYYAINSLGWGRGDSPDDARDAYYESVLRDVPSWTNAADWSEFVRRFDNRPTVFLAPDEARGFVINGGSTILWTGEDDEFIRRASDEDVVTV